MTWTIYTYIGDYAARGQYGSCALNANLTGEVSITPRKSHKDMKLKFLAAERWQRSQYGLLESFVRGGRQEHRYGIIGPADKAYQDRSYVECRGWKKKALETI
jgi:hypothetical protein